MTSASQCGQTVKFYPVASVYCRKMGGTASTAVDTPQEAASFVEKVVSEHKVAVFSKTTCGYCESVKRLFGELGVEPHYVELNQRSDEVLLKQVLVERTGSRSVPRVFIGGQFIGGCDETRALHRQGGLVERLKAAGAL